MKTYCRLIIAAVVSACFAGHVEAAKAKTYSKQVQRACANDYRFSSRASDFSRRFFPRSHTR